MKLLLAILVSGLFTALSIGIMPWWICGVVAFLVCLVLRLKPGQAFLAGLVGVGLGWGILAGWADAQNNAVLSTRIGQLFGGLSSFLVVAITILIGGMSGGFGGMSGGALASVLFHPRK